MIELYHHTIHAERYDTAFDLYASRLATPLYFRLGAYETCIQLLRALFPHGEDRSPYLQSQREQPWILNELAIAYARSGQHRRAEPLLDWAIGINERAGYKEDIAAKLGNLASVQLGLGQLREASASLRRQAALGREIGSGKCRLSVNAISG